MLLRILKAALGRRPGQEAVAPEPGTVGPAAGEGEKAAPAKPAPSLPRKTVNYRSMVSGVIHVGANLGQERDMYESYGLSVVWIEPIPEIFEGLEANIAGYPRQRALQCLVTDRDDAEYAFHIADNGGLSSSILDLAEHREVWPEVAYERSTVLRSITLASLLEREAIDPAAYPALVLDTQGSELLVLQGARERIGEFRFIHIEVADFEAYAGCCTLAEVDAFARSHGFTELHRIKFAEGPGGRSYYDVLYEKHRDAHMHTQPQ